jgi:hypothetical protein
MDKNNDNTPALVKLSEHEFAGTRSIEIMVRHALTGRREGMAKG